MSFLMLRVWYVVYEKPSFVIRLNLIQTWPDHVLDAWSWVSDWIILKFIYTVVITLYGDVMGIK